VTLVGARTRWWMILPASTGFAAIFIFRFTGYVAANIAYAAILLYGTKRIVTFNPIVQGDHQHIVLRRS
jgi:hypothetical protein